MTTSHHKTTRSTRVGPSATTILVALISVLMVTMGASNASGTPPALAASKDKPAIRLIHATEWVVPNGPYASTVALAGMPADATLRQVLYDSVPTRSSFNLTMTGSGFRGTGTVIPERPVAPGASNVTITFPTSDGSAPVAPGGATISSPGVYPLVTQVRDENGTTITELVSYVVRLPAAPLDGSEPDQKPLDVSTILGLHSTPAPWTGNVPTPTDATRAAVQAFVDGLAPGPTATESPGTGGLGFKITPELLDSLASSKEPRDTRLLAELREAIGQRQLLQLPYVSINIAQWLATEKLETRIPEFMSQAVRATSELLHTSDTNVVSIDSWTGSKPAPVTRSTVRWLTQAGYSRFIIRSTDVDGLDERLFPRSLTRPFKLAVPGHEPVDAVQVDDQLSRHFLEADPALGVNHLIADLAVLGLDLPALQRGVIVASPPNWKPSAAFISAYDKALQTSAPAGATPLIRPVDSNAIFTDVPQASSDGDRASSGKPLTRHLRDESATARADPRLGEDLDSTAIEVAALASMQPGGRGRSDSIITRLNRQVDAAGSTTLPATQQHDRLASVRRSIDERAKSVTVAPEQALTLTSKTADIPFTIHRAPNGPTLVHLSLAANDRIDFVDGDTREIKLTGTVTQIQLRVHTDSPGDNVVRATLTSPDGVIVIATSRLIVRSTAVSGMGVVITFGSLAFLLIWWARDVVRVRRRKRAAHIPPASLIDID